MDAIHLCSDCMSVQIHILYCHIHILGLALDYLYGIPLPHQGLAPNYVKVVPSIAIAFVSYEQIKEALGVEFRISE